MDTSNMQNIDSFTSNMINYWDTHSSNIPFYVYQQKRIIELEKKVKMSESIIGIEPK